MRLPALMPAFWAAAFRDGVDHYALLGIVVSRADADAAATRCRARSGIRGPDELRTLHAGEAFDNVLAQLGHLTHALMLTVWKVSVGRWYCGCMPVKKITGMSSCRRSNGRWPRSTDWNWAA